VQARVKQNAGARVQELCKACAMPKKITLALALRQVLPTNEQSALLVAEFRDKVLALCPGRTAASLVQVLYGKDAPSWLKKTGERMSRKFWAVPANAEEPPPAQPLALKPTPAAAALPLAAPPAASLGDFSNGGKRRPPPTPTAGGRRPFGRQPSRLSEVLSARARARPLPGAGGAGAPAVSPASAPLAAGCLQQPPDSPAAPTGAAPADSGQEGSSPLGAASGAAPPLRGAAAVPSSKPRPSRSGLTVSVAAQPAEALARVWDTARRLSDQRKPQPEGPPEQGEARSSKKRQHEGGDAPAHKKQPAGPAARPACGPSAKVGRGAALAAAAGVAMAAAAAAGPPPVAAARPPAAAAAARPPAAAAAARGVLGGRPAGAPAPANAPPRGDVRRGAPGRRAPVGGGGQQQAPRRSGQPVEQRKREQQPPKHRLAMSKVVSGGSGGDGWGR
jgi:hypothetical protein